MSKTARQRSRQNMETSINNWRVFYEEGRKWYQKGLVDKAISAFYDSIRANPDNAPVHYDLGVVLYQEGFYQEAFERFEQAVKLENAFALAWLGGGNALCTLQRFSQAIDWYHQALYYVQDCADIHYNLAKVYKETGMDPKAVAHYRQCVAIDPSHTEAYNNMGALLIKKDQLDQALECFETAIRLRPVYYQAAYNAAMTLQRLGRLEDALEKVRMALRIAPRNDDALALLVALLQQACDWKALPDAQIALERCTVQRLKDGRRPAEQPFLSFIRSPDPKRNFDVATAWSRWLLSRSQEGSVGDSNQHPRPDRRRITIGYLSEQFRNAATAHLTAGLFERHRRDKFHVIAYSWGQDDNSTYRRKIAQDVDRFVDIRGLSDREAARCIHDDKVDILVDLMGWMHGHRMGILSLRPAPVQVNYLGYPGTTGAPFMDYILADDIIIQPHDHSFFSEKVVSLPDCYQVTDPNPVISDSPVTRSSMGLPEDAFVFCAFTTDYKISPEIFGCWMKILHAVPGSVLWLIVRSDMTCRNLCSQAESLGIDARRLIFADPLPKPQHLSRIRLADLALDTFPVNGHTTTSDTLWAGVPVITLEGSHFASRVASSILHAVGMAELVTCDLNGYQRLAVELAENTTLLKQTRNKLDGYKRSKPLFDTDRFVGYLECAYETMWNRYLNGKPARSFAVEPQVASIKAEIGSIKA
jgi:protein O-GlcNAc transferase